VAETNQQNGRPIIRISPASGRKRARQNLSFTRANPEWNFCNLRPNELCGYSGSVQLCIQSYRIMKSLARGYLLLAAHPALAAVLSSASGFAVFICIRLLETKERRTERLLRKQQREVKALTRENLRLCVEHA
jgi:hypothetical protein